MATRKIVTKDINTTVAAYVGSDGELFYDTATNTLKISDGTTAGGVTVVTDGTGVSGLTGVGTVGTPRLAADYAVAVGSFSAINAYAVNLGFGAGNAAAGYSINTGFQAGQFAVDNYNTRIGFHAGRYGSSASFGVAIGYEAGVTVVGTSSDAVVSGTSLNIGTGTGFAVGQYLNTNLPGPPDFLPDTYIVSGTSPNFVLNQPAMTNGTGVVESYGKYPGGVIINGSTGAGLPAVNTGFYLKPVRDGGPAAGMPANGFKPCYYNPTTGEFVYASS